MAGYQPRHDTDPVWFNGQQVNALTYVSAQVGVLITAVYGWDDRPDVRDTRENRAGDDGEWADNLFLGGRTITVEGEVMGSSWVNLQSRKRSLAAIFNPTSDEVLFKIPDPATVSPTGVYAESGMTGYERCYCRVIEAIQFGDTLDPMCQTWQVVLRASDPRIYSDTVTTTDSSTSGTGSRTVTVDQSGTYETPVDLTVTGPTAATWSVSSSDALLSLSIPSKTVVSGKTFVFSTRDRTALDFSDYEDYRINAAGLTCEAVWMLDESAGTTADNAEGTSANDGTYTGGYTLNQSGPNGLASVDLNGTTGYVSLPAVADVWNIRTVELWARFDSLSGNDCLFDTTGSNKGIQIYRTGSQIHIKAGVGSGYFDSTTWGYNEYIALATSTWYRIQALVWNITASAVTLHLAVYDEDNDWVGSAGWVLMQGQYSPQTSGNGRIGATLAGADFMDGRVAAVAAWSTSDSTNIVQTLPIDTSGGDGYRYLESSASRWANLSTASTTYTLASSGLNTGSKLSVSYRAARL